jgi:hypothetical protein
MTYLGEPRGGVTAIGDGATDLAQLESGSTSVPESPAPDPLGWAQAVLQGAAQTGVALVTSITADSPSTDDNVDQLATGASVGMADYTSVGGVCKARNKPALTFALNLQNQLNRVAQAKGFSKIKADGAIGPATMTLFNQVQAASGGQVMQTVQSCVDLAGDSDVLGAQVQAYADSIGAPSKVTSPVSLTPPTIVTKSGKEIAGDALGIGSMSLVEKLAIAGVVGGIGWMVYTGKKKRRK